MKSSRRVVRLGARVAGVTAVVVSAAVAGIAASPGTDRTVQAVGEALGAGGEYHALAPARILDTRDAALDVAPLGRKATNVTFDVPISDKGGLPAFTDANADGSDDDVLAVAVNITVVNPPAPGFLQAYGTGATAGESSIVNFFPGQVVANSAVLRPGAGGSLTINVATPGNSGQVDVLIDVFGWFSSSTYETFGARVVPITPARIFDSREAAFGATPLGATQERAVPIRGAQANGAEVVPNSTNVVGVVLNITAVNNLPGSAPTYLALNPQATAAGVEPSTSNINVRNNQFRSSLAIVPVGADGNVHLYNRVGTAHAILDVVGYLVKGVDPLTRQGRIIPLVAPFRAFDTRQAVSGGAPLPPANAEDWSFASFIADTKVGAEPVGPQLGLIGNLTAAELGRRPDGGGRASFLTGYPTPAGTGTQVPDVSNIVIAGGEVNPNLALLKYGQGPADDTNCAAAHCLRFYNRDGYLHYLLDVSAVILAD